MKKWNQVVVYLAAIALAMAVLGCGNAALKSETTAGEPAVVTENDTAEAAEKPAKDAAPDATGKPSATIKVTVVIDGSAAGDQAISFRGETELPEGATAYDALAVFCEKQGIVIEGDSAFVTSIGELGENSLAGKSCGWMYDVNGEMVWEAANDLIISDGDQVNWVFSVW